VITNGSTLCYVCCHDYKQTASIRDHQVLQCDRAGVLRDYWHKAKNSEQSDKSAVQVSKLRFRLTGVHVHILVVMNANSSQVSVLIKQFSVTVRTFFRNTDIGGRTVSSESGVLEMSCLSMKRLRLSAALASLARILLRLTTSITINHHLVKYVSVTLMGYPAKLKHYNAQRQCATNVVLHFDI